MGKKTRTRRTKWRRLSLGEASGPEEEDDEQQSEGVVVVLQQQSSDNELSGDEQQQATDERPVSNDEMPTHEDNAASAASTASPATRSAPSSTHQSSPTWKLNNTMPNNNANNHQYDKAQGRSTSPATCDQQQPHQQQSQPQAHHQQQHHQPHGKSQGYYNYHYPPNGLNSYNNGHANYQSGNPQQQRPPFRRGGPHRYGGNNHPHSNGGGGYGRANSWTNGSYSGANNGCDPPKSHGIEKKIFNDEEYTKISTPRQEVLFKKGSIGKKRPNVATPSTAAATTPAGAVNADTLNNDDNLNGNAATSTAPTSPIGDGDSVHYNGCNDGGSTGDASSTAGETQSPDAAAQNYDGAPVVCFPMYDLYGGYGGLYSGVVWQAYPGGPLVTAVPVPVPVQPVEWYRAPNGEVNYVYSLVYPTEPVMEDNSPRSNSVESFQACSNQEVNSEGSMTTSENSSPCSTGPSSQGPASPQNELASPNGMDGIKGGGDSLENHKMAAVPGYIYHTGYAPAPVFAAGSGLGPSVESACDSASSSCSANQNRRDVVALTAPTDEAASSSGSGKQVQSNLKSQDKQNHCGSGGEAGTGASAGSDTLGRRKKRKKKRKSRPRDPLIPWVTDNSHECPEQTVGDDGNVSAQIPSASNAPCASASSFGLTTTTTASTTSPTTTDTTTTPVSSSDHTHSSDLSPSDSSSELADLELDASNGHYEQPSVQSPQPSQSLPATETVIAESPGPPAISSSPVEPSADIPVSNQDFVSADDCSNDPADSHPLDSGQKEDDNDISGAEPTAREPAIALSHPVSEEEGGERSQNIDPPEATLTWAAEIDSEPAPPPSDSAARGSGDAGNNGQNGEQPADEPPPTEVTDAPTSFDSLDSDSLIDGSQLDAYEEDSLEDREDLLPLLSNQSDDVNLSDGCHGQNTSDGCLDPEACKDLNEFECLLAEECGRSRTSSATSEGFEAITSDLIVDLLEQIQSWPEVSAVAEAAPEPPLSKVQAAAVESGPDVDSPFQEEEEDAIVDNADIYFDDTPSPPPPPPVQLWKTVILEESEPSSKQMSRQSSSESDVSTLKEAPAMISSSFCYLQGDEVGPITSAVCHWLDSAPIQEKLIASTAELDAAETDEDEIAESSGPELPKNEETDPCTAPSSEDAAASLDGPQRRVEAPAHQALGADSTDSNPQQQPDIEEIAAASDTDASSVCDPARYSIYYQLGISLEDVEDNESPAGDPSADAENLETFKRIHSAGDRPKSLQFESEPPSTLPAQLSTDSGISSIESSIVPLPDSASVSPEPTTAVPAESAGSKRSRRMKSKSDPVALSSSSLSSGHTKRNSWRRTLRVLRAVHLLKKTSDKRKPLKSGQSCCAIQ